MCAFVFVFDNHNAGQCACVRGGAPGTDHRRPDPDLLAVCFLSSFSSLLTPRPCISFPSLPLSLSLFPSPSFPLPLPLSLPPLPPSLSPAQDWLHWAAYEGREPLLRCLLAKPGVRPDVYSEEGLTPLHLAAHVNSVPLVTALLAAGAKVRAQWGVGFGGRGQPWGGRGTVWVCVGRVGAAAWIAVARREGGGSLEIKESGIGNGTGTQR